MKIPQKDDSVKIRVGWGNLGLDETCESSHTDRRNPPYNVRFEILTERFYPLGGDYWLVDEEGRTTRAAIWFIANEPLKGLKRVVFHAQFPDKSRHLESRPSAVPLSTQIVGTEPTLRSDNVKWSSCKNAR